MRNTNGAFTGEKIKMSWELFDQQLPIVRKILSEVPHMPMLADRIVPTQAVEVLYKNIQKLNSDNTLACYGPDHPQATGYAERRAIIGELEDLGL